MNQVILYLTIQYHSKLPQWLFFIGKIGNK